MCTSTATTTATATNATATATRWLKMADHPNVSACDHGSSTLDHPQQEKSSSHELTLQSKRRPKFRIIFSTRDSESATIQKGARVEVKTNEEGFHGARYAATVVGSAGQDKVLVQYDTLTTDDQMQPLVEMARVSDITPLPPPIGRKNHFHMLEEVDAWYNDGWWVGVVTKALARLKYVVYFWTTNEEFEFQHSDLRSHREFINGKWVASSSSVPKLAENPRLEKMRLRAGVNTSTVDLFCGLKVEIAYGAGRHLSSWYPAIVLGSVSQGRYLVRYPTLKTPNGDEYVEEEVDALCIRPSPPIIQQARQFVPNDVVDAWDGHGWRMGQIYSAMKGFKYGVYFCATDTVVEYQHAYLRPHQDLINGVWFGNYN